MAEKPKVTFVLGAGSSKEYNVYMQSEVPGQLTSILSNRDNRYTKVMSYLGYESSLIDDFIENLYDSDESIDSWLALPENSEYLDVGKVSLTLLLLDCEQEIQRRGDSWYNILYRNHLKTRFLKDFSENNKNIAFITFNYDRTLEWFLYKVLCAKHSTLHERVAEELKKLKIIHVYNSFGNLPWQDETDMIPYFSLWNQTLKMDRPDKFDPLAIAGDVKKASENIELMFGDDLTPQFKEARTILKSSDKIFFIGFGYWEDNLRKLGFDYDTPWRDKQIKGTAYEISDAKIEEVSQFTNGIFGRENMVKMKCQEFIKHLERDIRNP